MKPFMGPRSCLIGSTGLSSSELAASSLHAGLADLVNRFLLFSLAFQQSHNLSSHFRISRERHGEIRVIVRRTLNVTNGETLKILILHAFLIFRNNPIEFAAFRSFSFDKKKIFGMQSPLSRAADLRACNPESHYPLTLICNFSQSTDNRARR